MSKVGNEDSLPYLILGKYMLTAANHDLFQSSKTTHPFSVPFKYFTEHKCQDPWSLVFKTLPNLFRNLGHLPFFTLMAAPLLSIAPQRLLTLILSLK